MGPEASKAQNKADGGVAVAFWEVGHRWGLQTSWGEPQGRSCCFVHIRGVQDGGLFQCTGAEGTPGFCGVEAGRVGSLEENPGAGPTQLPGLSAGYDLALVEPPAGAHRAAPGHFPLH